MDLQPGSAVAWILVGLVAGWVAGQLMRGGGDPMAADLFAGAVGALMGGLLFALLVPGAVGFAGSPLVAFVGAVVLVAVLRAVSSPRRLV